MVEKYWKARPGSISLSCASVGHNCLREFGDKIVQCVICASVHKVENHRYRITSCIVKMGKICTYVIFRYANYRAKYQTTTFKCQTRLKAQIEAWRKKFKQFQVKDKQPVTFVAPEKKLEKESNKIEIDILLTL